jgi:hypothetical protein
LLQLALVDRKEMTALSVVVGALAFLLSVFLLPWSHLLCNGECRAVNAVYAKRNFMVLAESKYHHRPQEEKELKTFSLSNLKNNRYLIVVGPHGCGKSTVVRAAITGKHGALRTSFASTTKLGEAYNAILAGIGVSDYPVSSEQGMAELFRKVQQQKVPGDPLWGPIVVVEFDGGLEEDLIKMMTPSLKKLGADEQAAYVVLVLSDANAVFALKPDPDRQQFLWVGDPTIDEAHDVLDRFGHLHCNRSDDVDVGSSNCTLRARIFNNWALVSPLLLAPLQRAMWRHIFGSVFPWLLEILKG